MKITKERCWPIVGISKISKSRILLCSLTVIDYLLMVHCSDRILAKSTVGLLEGRMACL